MNPDIKRRFKERILEVASDYGLNEIMMTSYSRQFDARTQLSATDMAFAVCALLETPYSEEASSKDSENVNPNQVGDGNGDAKPINSVELVHSRLHSNFWIAYDALDLRQN